MATMSTTRTSRISLVGAVLLFVAAAPADAARKPRGCAEGRFVVTKGQELLGGGSDPAILVVQGSSLTVEGACPATGTAVSRRKGTRVTAEWAQCGTVGKLRLRATARDCSTARGTIRARKRRQALVAAASTCGDGVIDRGGGEQCEGAAGCEAGVQCSTSCHCGPEAEPLDCETAGYPCEWSGVPADVKRRTFELAGQAAAILAGGGSTAEAADLLAAASPEELQGDERLLRFRLAGGRAAWVGRVEDLHPTGDAPAEPSPAVVTNTAGQSLRRGGLAPRAVLSPGAEKRRALVLDPFAWDPRMHGMGATVAGILQNTKTYEGNVGYLANASGEDLTVTPAEFARFDGNSVVYVVSHGGYLCNDLRTKKEIPCRSFITASRTSNDTAAALEDAGVGVEVFRSTGDLDGWTIALTGDFFRHHYPGGVRDALVFFDACASYDREVRTDIARVLEGPNSNFVGWSEPVSGLGSAIITQHFMERLSTGRALHEVYESMQEDVGVRDRFSGAYLVVGDRSIRIRDLPRLIDAFSGDTLTSSGQVEVTGYTGDGKPDSLVLLAEFEGIGAAEGDAYRVVFTVNGQQFAGVPLTDFASPLGDYRWSGSAELELGYDVTEGQTLDIELTLVLPEGGTSKFAASPRASSPAWKYGRKWQGRFTKVFDGGLYTTTLTVDATFVRDPGETGKTSHPTFVLQSGTMTWSLMDHGGDSCVWSAPATSADLGADDRDYFTFDLTTKPVQYHGFAETRGTRVPLTATCSGGMSDPPPVTTEAGGVWFLAPEDEGFVVSEAAIAGEYHVNSLSAHSWFVSKVE